MDISSKYCGERGVVAAYLGGAKNTYIWLLGLVIKFSPEDLTQLWHTCRYVLITHARRIEEKTPRISQT